MYVDIASLPTLFLTYDLKYTYVCTYICTYECVGGKYLIKIEIFGNATPRGYN